MKLQVALDLTNKKDAMRIAKKVAKYIDVIELGTPLVKQEGLRIVRGFRKFRKPILTDLKTMDTGFLEAELAFRAGADLMTVCGCSDNATILGAVKAARKYRKAVVVDLIGTKNVTRRIKEVLKLGANFVEVHTGIDVQKRGVSPLGDLRKISRVVDRKKISVAGGINLKNIDLVIKYKPEIIVVGGAITKSKNPEKTAKLLKEKLK